MQAVTDKIDYHHLPIVSVIIYFLHVGEESKL